MTHTITEQSKSPRRSINPLIFDGDKKISFRLSTSYAPAGHDFTKSFRVILVKYFLEYRIITFDAKNLYQYLHELSEIGKEFTMRELEQQLRWSDQKIRKLLDELENLELIEVLKVADEAGCPNTYLIKTPFFSRDLLMAGKGAETRKKIFDAGGKFPTVDLESQLPRLKENLAKNVAKYRRQHPLEFPELQEKKVIWQSIVKIIGRTNAATFANAIHKVSGYLSVEKNWQWNTLYSEVEKYFGDEIKLTDKLKKCAQKLVRLYQFYHNATVGGDEAAPPMRPRQQPTQPTQQPATTQPAQQPETTLPTNEAAALAEMALNHISNVFSTPVSAKMMRVEETENAIDFLKNEMLYTGLTVKAIINALTNSIFPPETLKEIELRL